MLASMAYGLVSEEFGGPFVERFLLLQEVRLCPHFFVLKAQG